MLGHSLLKAYLLAERDLFLQKIKLKKAKGEHASPCCRGHAEAAGLAEGQAVREAPSPRYRQHVKAEFHSSLLTGVFQMSLCECGRTHVFALAGVALRLPRRPVVAKSVQLGARRRAGDRQHGHCGRETARLTACVSLSPGTGKLRLSQASAAPNQGADNGALRGFVQPL